MKNPNIKNETNIFFSLMSVIVWALLGAIIGFIIGYNFGFFTEFGFFGQKVQPIATQSAVGISISILGLISGLILGARYKSLTNLKSLIATLFFSIIISAFIGLIAGIGILYFKETGAFISWEILDSPVKFQKIVEANTNAVWAQAVDDKLYSRSTNCYSDPKCNTWVEIKAIPDGIHDFDSIKSGATCDLGGGYVPKKQLDHVAECYLARMGMYESSWTVYYALLNDGTIWLWSYTSNGFDFIYLPLLSIVIGVFMGVVLGLIIFIVKKSKKRPPLAPGN